MKKLLSSILIISILFILYLVMRNNSINFNDLFKKNNADISKIKITRLIDQQEASVVDKVEIDTLLRSLANMNLNKVNNSEVNNKTSLFMVGIKDNYDLLLGITFYSDNLISVYDGSSGKDRISMYKINKFDANILNEYMK